MSVQLTTQTARQLQQVLRRPFVGTESAGGLGYSSAPSSWIECVRVETAVGSGSPWYGGHVVLWDSTANDWVEYEEVWIKAGDDSVLQTDDSIHVGRGYGWQDVTTSPSFPLTIKRAFVVNPAPRYSLGGCQIVGSQSIDYASVETALNWTTIPCTTIGFDHGGFSNSGNLTIPAGLPTAQYMIVAYVRLHGGTDGGIRGSRVLINGVGGEWIMQVVRPGNSTYGTRIYTPIIRRLNAGDTVHVQAGFYDATSVNKTADGELSIINLRNTGTLSSGGFSGTIGGS